MFHPAEQNLALVRQGIAVLRGLPQGAYTHVVRPHFQSSAGKHVRHILNFYECFLEGLAVGNVDYDARRRDPVVETDCSYAVGRLMRVMEALAEIDAGQSCEPLLVKQNEGGASNPMHDWCGSTVGRELQALVSHTVHHFAIIALMLRIQGIDCPDDLGVAPSTLKYERSLACAASRG